MIGDWTLYHPLNFPYPPCRFIRFFGKWGNLWEDENGMFWFHTPGLSAKLIGNAIQTDEILNKSHKHMEHENEREQAVNRLTNRIRDSYLSLVITLDSDMDNDKLKNLKKGRMLGSGSITLLPSDQLMKGWETGEITEGMSSAMIAQTISSIMINEIRNSTVTSMIWIILLHIILSKHDEISRECLRILRDEFGHKIGNIDGDFMSIMDEIRRSQMN